MCMCSTKLLLSYNVVLNMITVNVEMFLKGNNVQNIYFCLLYAVSKTKHQTIKIPKLGKDKL